MKPSKIMAFLNINWCFRSTKIRTSEESREGGISGINNVGMTVSRIRGLICAAGQQDPLMTSHNGPSL